MKKSILLVLFITSTLLSFSQDFNSDLSDASKELMEIEKNGLPIISAVDAMKLKADSLFRDSQWKQSIVMYETFAKNANWVANLLSECIKPYYSASYDDKKGIGIKTLEKIIPFEKKSNYYKNERDIAYIKMGLCYKNLGDNKNAMAYLQKGVGLLNVKQDIYWFIAVNAIAEILQFDQTK